MRLHVRKMHKVDQQSFAKYSRGIKNLGGNPVLIPNLSRNTLSVKLGSHYELKASKLL